MELMAHQKDALDFLSSRNGAGIFFEMGCGKSLTLLEHLNKIKEKGDSPFPALIAAPLSVLGVWEAEIKKFNYPFTNKIVYGSKIKRVEALREPADIYIINYEGMRILEHELLQKNFKTFVSDESHRLKDLKSQQTISAIKISEKTTYRYLLSGTPMTKSPEDLWSQLMIIDRDWLWRLFNNFWAFRARYVEYQKRKIRVRGTFREINVPVRFKNLKELEERLSDKCIRKTKAECLDLPEKIYCKVPVHLNSEQVKHYNALLTGLKTIIDDKMFNVNQIMSAVQKARQICNGFIYMSEGETFEFKENPKLKILEDLISDISSQKIIVFTYFKYDNEIICKKTFDNKTVLIYDGDADERSRIVREFTEKEEPMILVANIDKAKEGINLTVSNTVIYYSNTYSYATRAQSEDRCHRKGQTGKVTYYDLVCTNTIEERVLDLLQLKKDSADEVMGDARRLAELFIGE